MSAKKITVIIENAGQDFGSPWFSRTIMVIKPKDHKAIEDVTNGGGLKTITSNSMYPLPAIHILEPLP